MHALLCLRGIGAGRRVAHDRETGRSHAGADDRPVGHLARNTVKAPATRIGDSFNHDLEGAS